MGPLLANRRHGPHISKRQRRLRVSYSDIREIMWAWWAVHVLISEGMYPFFSRAAVVLTVPIAMIVGLLGSTAEEYARDGFSNPAQIMTPSRMRERRYTVQVDELVREGNDYADQDTR